MFINICIMIIIISAIVYAGIIIWIWDKNNKDINRLKEYEININSEVTEETPKLLDTIITECFNEYIILNIEYQKGYINEELESKILKGTGEIVSKRMSPALLSKLSLYYNSNYISDIISDKIYITVMSYVLEKNSIKDAKEEL